MTSSPELSASGRQPRGSCRSHSLQRCVLGEASAGLLRLRQPELACGHRLDAEWREQIGDLAHLAFIVTGDDEARASPQASTPILGDGELLQLHELGDAALGQRHQLIELRLAEGLLLGGALHLDDAARARHHEIGVGLRL